MWKSKIDKIEWQPWFQLQYAVLPWRIDYVTNYSQYFSDAFELSEEEKRILDIKQENIELKRAVDRYKYLEKKKMMSSFSL
jgi:hypothetical protein